MANIRRFQDSKCHLRIPTDMKLLWESVEWLHRQIIGQCSELHIRRPRNKFDDICRVLTIPFTLPMKTGNIVRRMG